MSEMQRLARQYHNKEISYENFALRLAALIQEMSEATADIIAVRLLLPL